MRVEKAGCELRVGPLRELVDVGVPVLPPDCEADPPEGAEGAEGAGAVAGRSVVVTIGGATGLGAGVGGARCRDARRRRDGDRRRLDRDRRR